MVKLFLKHRPELATLANVEGATCTHIAAAKGSLAVIRELLKFKQGGVTTLSNKVRGQGLGVTRSQEVVFLCAWLKMYHGNRTIENYNVIE